MSTHTDGSLNSESATASPDAKLLASLAGSIVKESEFSCAINHTIHLLQRQRPLAHEMLHPMFLPGLPERQRLVHLCCEIVNLIRGNPRYSIDRLVEHLQLNKVVATSEIADVNNSTLDTIFSAILGLTRIAVPSGSRDLGFSFQIDRQGAKCPFYQSIDWDKARRPLDDMLRNLGETLPRRVVSGDADPELGALNNEAEYTRFFHVSNLNAAALKKLAGMRFVWVDSIAAHLELDPNLPALYLFRSPSLYELQASEASFLTLFASVFYADEEFPGDGSFSVSRLVDELALTYSLLFKDNGEARRLYRKSERDNAAIMDGHGKATVDPYLDRSCGYNSWSQFTITSSDFRETYPPADFPIFQQRLHRLQRFMEAVQPNDIGSIWHDKRDRRLWWTFWTVLIFGIMTILLALVSIGLAIWQGLLSQRQVELAELQTS